MFPFGLGSLGWDVHPSEYLAGMSMAPITEHEKEVARLANELRTNPKLRSWSALLIRGLIKSLGEELRQKVRKSQIELSPTGHLQNREVIANNYEKLRKERERIIAQLMKKFPYVLVPFWEESVAEKLLHLTEEGELTQEAIEKAFEPKPELADFFKAAIARSLVQTTG